MTKEDLLILAQRMTANETINVGESNTDKDSWAAHREAEEIKDEKVIPLMCDFIKDKINNDEYRDAIYHALVFTCYHTTRNWTTIFDLLIEEDAIECKRSVYLQIANINSSPEYDSWKVNTHKGVHLLLSDSKSSHYSLRKRALSALPYASVLREEVEFDTLTAIEKYKDDGVEELETLIDILAHQGSKRCIPLWKELMEQYKNAQWISVIARNLGHYGGEDEEDYLIEQFSEQRNAFVKSILCHQLTQVGTEKSIPTVIAKVKKVLAKKGRADAYYMDIHWYELIDLLAFLKKYQEKNKPEIIKLFKWVKEKKGDNLAPKEVAWIQENLS